MEITHTHSVFTSAGAWRNVLQLTNWCYTDLTLCNNVTILIADLPALLESHDIYAQDLVLLLLLSLT